MKKTLLTLIALGAGFVGLAGQTARADTSTSQPENTTAKQSTSQPDNESPVARYQRVETATEATLKGLEGKNATEIQDLVLKYQLQPSALKMREDTSDEMKRMVENARTKSMEMDLSILEGIYAGTVQVKKEGNRYQTSGTVPGMDKYKTFENLMIAKLRVRMNLDMNKDNKITEDEIRALKFYLYEKVAKNE